MRYFTSDFHLGSSTILSYAKRPYSSAKDMTSKLTEMCNKTAGKADVIFHVGDFALVGADRHGDVADVGMTTADAASCLQRINANVVLLNGNHDTAHNFPGMCTRVIIDLNDTWKGISVSHLPEAYRLEKMSSSCKEELAKKRKQFRVHLCGHVHQKWKAKYSPLLNVLDINVGIDVWNYELVSEQDICKLLQTLKDLKVLARLEEQKKPRTFSSEDLEAELRVAKCRLLAARAKRKAEKHAKKGLTPEECERRKQVALAAKALKAKILTK